jgi:hypothetical protein
MRCEVESGDLPTIGFIGSGSLGVTLARLAVAAGYSVVLSNSRGQQALKDFVAELGYDSIDAGTLGAGGRRFQFGSRAFVSPYGTFSDERGAPAGVAAMRLALGM